MYAFSEPMHPTVKVCCALSGRTVHERGCWPLSLVLNIEALSLRTEFLRLPSMDVVSVSHEPLPKLPPKALCQSYPTVKLGKLINAGGF
jgi:hypothetical protein